MGTLGSLAVSIVGDSGQMEKAFDGVKKKTQDLGKSMQTIGKSVSNTGKSMTKLVTGPIVAAGAAIGGLALKTASYGDELDKTSSRLGVSVEGLQDWRYWADQNGVESSTLERAVGRLNQRIGDASDGTGRYAEAFKNLGVSIEDGNGKIRETDAVMRDAINSIMEYETPAERSAAASELFGTRVARDLLPALEDGSLTIDEAVAAMDKHGRVTEEQAKQSAEFKDALGDLKMGFMGVVHEVGNKLIPIFMDTLVPAIESHVLPVIGKLAGYIEKAAQWFGDLDPVLQKIIIAIVGLVAAIGPALVIIGKLISVAGAVAGVLSIKAIVIGAVIAAVVALVGYLAKLATENEELMAKLSHIWETIKAVAEEVWGAIKEFLLELWETLGPAIMDVWESLSETAKVQFERIQDIVETIFGAIQEFWDTWGDTIIVLVETVWNQIKIIIDTAINLIKDIILLVLAVIRGDWEEVWERIKSIGETIWNLIKETLENVFTGIKEFLVEILQTIQEWFSEIWTDIKEWFFELLEGIAEFFIELWESIKEFFIELWDSLKEWFFELLEGIAEFFIELWDSLKEWFFELLEGIEEFFIETWDSLKEWFFELLEGIAEFFIELWDSLKEWFFELLEGIAEFFRDTWESIKEFFEEWWNAYWEFWEGIWTGLRDWFSALWGTIRDNTIGFVKSMREGIENAFRAVIDWAMERWNAFKGFMGDVWEGISGLVKGGVNSVLASVESMINGAISMVNSFIRTINRRIRGLNRVPGVNIPTIGTLSKVSLPRLARGGLIGEEGWAMVGERGPEAVRLPEGAQVYPNSQTERMGKSVTIENINFYSPEPISPSKAAKLQEKTLRRLGLEWGLS